MLHIETQKPVKRVKYTKETSTDGKWLGMLEDGRVVTLEASFMYQNFGKRFLNECKMLEDNKFVGIPIGSARSSVINIYYPVCIVKMHLQISIHRMTPIAVFSSHWPLPSTAQVFNH